MNLLSLTHDSAHESVILKNMILLMNLLSLNTHDSAHEPVMILIHIADSYSSSFSCWTYGAAQIPAHDLLQYLMMMLHYCSVLMNLPSYLQPMIQPSLLLTNKSTSSHHNSLCSSFVFQLRNVRLCSTSNPWCCPHSCSWICFFYLTS